MLGKGVPAVFQNVDLPTGCILLIHGTNTEKNSLMFNIVKFIRFVYNNTPKPPLSNRLRIMKNMTYQRCIGYLAPVPLSIFRSNSKFDENSKHSGVKYTRPITTICTRHDSVTVVTCAKYRCDRSSIFETRVFWIFIEFRIRSKYAWWDGRLSCKHVQNRYDGNTK